MSAAVQLEHEFEAKLSVLVFASLVVVEVLLVHELLLVIPANATASASCTATGSASGSLTRIPRRSLSVEYRRDSCQCVLLLVVVVRVLVVR